MDHALLVEINGRLERIEQKQQELRFEMIELRVKQESLNFKLNLLQGSVFFGLFVLMMCIAAFTHR